MTRRKGEDNEIEDGVSEVDALGDIPGLVDTKHEEEGEWFEHAPDPDSEEPTRPNQIDGFRHLLMDANGNGLRRILVRSRYTKAYQREEASVQARAVRMSPEKRQKFVRREVASLTAKHCIGDWDFTDRQGVQIPCSREMAERVMSDGRLRHHASFATLAVAMLQGDIERVVEADRGN